MKKIIKKVTLKRLCANHDIIQGILSVGEFKCHTMEMKHSDMFLSPYASDTAAKLQGAIVANKGKQIEERIFRFLLSSKTLGKYRMFPYLRYARSNNPMFAPGGTLKALLPWQIMLGKKWLTPFELDPDPAPYGNLLNWLEEQFYEGNEVELVIDETELEICDDSYEDFVEREGIDDEAVELMNWLDDNA